MVTIHCELSEKTYLVKKVCKILEMPQTAQYYNTCYFNGQSQDIYRTDAGVLYAKQQTWLNLNNK